MASTPKHIRELKKKLEAQGFEVRYDGTTKGQHCQITVSKNGKSGRYISSLSPSCHRAEKNMIAIIRRDLCNGTKEG